MTRYVATGGMAGLAASLRELRQRGWRVVAVGPGSVTLELVQYGSAVRRELVSR